MVRWTGLLAVLAMGCLRGEPLEVETTGIDPADDPIGTEPDTGTLPPLDTPVLSLAVSLKELQFSWSAVSRATTYTVFEEMPQGVRRALRQLDGATTEVRVPVALFEHLGTTYVLEACDDATGACSLSKEVGPPDLMAGIGYFKAENAREADAFGWSVATCRDGSRIAVGASGDSSGYTGVFNPGDSAILGDDAAPNSGAVHLYSRGPLGNWVAEAYLKASNASENTGFGSRVALSGDCRTLAVGAPSQSGSAGGVNADETTSGLTWSGAVYVFGLDTDDTWLQTAYLKATHPGFTDRYGSSLALDDAGTLLVVGAPGESSAATGVLQKAPDDDSANNTGALYTYVRSNSALDSWAEDAFLKSDDKSPPTAIGGSPIALDAAGTWLVVGNPIHDRRRGRVLQFSRSDTGQWSSELPIEAPTTAEPSDEFGFSVALSADGLAMVVGAPSGDARAVDGGAAYVFRRSTQTDGWDPDTTLTSTDATTGDDFGSSVSIDTDGSRVAVGAPGEDGGIGGVLLENLDEDAADSGAVYVFDHVGQSWQQRAVLKAPVPTADEGIGERLTMSRDGDTVVVGSYKETGEETGIGAPMEGDAERVGAVYLY